MSERGKRVFRFLLDPERDADVIGRIEAKQPMTGYVRELVRRDMHDERLDYAALKASELLAENAKLRELVEDMAAEIRGLGIDFKRVGWCDYADRMRELGVDS